MVATCPQCHTRYRLAEEKIGARGARIRCARCETVFSVDRGEAVPAAAAASPGGSPAPAAKPAVAPAAAPAAAAARKPEPARPAPAPAPARDAATARFLVAEADPEIGKALVERLTAWRISTQWVQDGAQALLQIHRKRPDGVILGGRLPGLAAPGVCEIVRRTAELSGVKLIRVASLDEPAGAPEFEAEHVVQPGALLEGIGPILSKLGLGQPPEAPARPASTPAGGGAKPAASPATAAVDPRVAAAERLARIIVSDIILYNEAKFRAAAAQGDVVAALEHELGEASALFRQRIPEEVRATRNFLGEELEARAAKYRTG